MPRPDRRRAGWAALLLAAAVAGGPALAQESGPLAPDRRLKELETAIQRGRAEHEQIKQKAQALAKESADLKAEMVQAARVTQEHEETLSELEAQLKDLRGLEGEKLDTLDRRRAQMVGVLTALERLAWRPSEALIAQPTSPADTVRSAILLRTVLPRVMESAAALKDELDALTNLRSDIGRQRQKMAAVAEKLAGERSRVAGLFDRKQALQQQAVAATEESERRLRGLAAEAEDLRDLLQRLEDERKRQIAEQKVRDEDDRRRREAEAAAARAAHEAEELAKRAQREAERVAAKAQKDAEEAAQKAAREAEKAAKDAAREADRRAAEDARQAKLAAATAAREAEAAAAQRARDAEAATKAVRDAEIKAAHDAEAAAREARDKPVMAALPKDLAVFSKAQGHLPFPARGAVSAEYGEANDLGVASKGITIETRPGAQVVAPYDGQVVFAGTFRGYGQLLIIEHSEGYHTLLAGMARIDGTVGQRLGVGEPVGVMAQTEGKPALYMELRRNGQPINPLPWLSARKHKVSG